MIKNKRDFTGYNEEDDNSPKITRNSILLAKDTTSKEKPLFK